MKNRVIIHWEMEFDEEPGEKLTDADRVRIAKEVFYQEDLGDEHIRVILCE